MRVLVVEDDDDLARQLRDCLIDAGYVIDVAPDGEEGHWLGANEPYDAVVLDLGLPLMDGITVLERWRREVRRSSDKSIVTLPGVMLISIDSIRISPSVVTSSGIASTAGWIVVRGRRTSAATLMLATTSSHMKNPARPAACAVLDVNVDGITPPLARIRG